MAQPSGNFWGGADREREEGRWNGFEDRFPHPTSVCPSSLPLPQRDRPWGLQVEERQKRSGVGVRVGAAAVVFLVVLREILAAAGFLSQEDQVKLTVVWCSLLPR